MGQEQWERPIVPLVENIFKMKAARAVAVNARSIAEAKDFLEMLGLIDDLRAMQDSR